MVSNVSAKGLALRTALLIDLFGYEKILFATDYPLLDQSKALAAMRSLPLAPGVLTAILGGNASSLLGRRGG